MSSIVPASPGSSQQSTPPQQAISSSMQSLDDYLSKYHAGPRKKGILVRLWNFLFGERLKEVHVREQGKIITFMGTFLSPLLLILFSISAVLVIDKQWVIQIPYVAEALPSIDVATTLLFVVAMDVCLFLAIMWIKNTVVSKRPWTGGRVILIGILSTFSLMIVSVEAITFYSLLTNANLTAFLNISRAILIPFCVVFMIAKPQQLLSREDIDQFILEKVAAAMLQVLEDLVISGKAQFADLLELFMHLSLPDNADAAKVQQERDKTLTELLSKMNPSATHQLALQQERRLFELAEQVKQRDTLIAELRDQMATLQQMFTLNERTNPDAHPAQGAIQQPHDDDSDLLRSLMTQGA